LADRHNTLPPQETLAVMNSHLGRFLVHADELLQECRGFGESLRSSLEGELEKMHDTVAHGLDAAAQRTAEHAAAQLGTALDAALGDRLAVLRRELDELGRQAQQAQQAQRAAGRADGSAPLPGLPVKGTAVAPPASARTPWPRGLTVLLASANLMLAALLVLAVLIVLDRGSGRASGQGTAQAGAAGAAGNQDGGPAGQGAPGTSASGIQAPPGTAALPGTTGTAGDTTSGAAEATSWPALCQPLAGTADAARAHAFVAAAAAAACGDDAGAVTANVLAGVRAVPQTPGAAPGKPGSTPGDQPGGKPGDGSAGKPDDKSAGAASGATPKRSRRSKPSE
jgi:hypothetical protein